MAEHSIQQVYQELSETFSTLEFEFMQLEKGYFLLSENFEKILDLLDKLHHDMLEGGHKDLAKRIIAMKSVIFDLRKKRGYDINAFQSIFFLMKKLAQSAPDEIVGVKKLADDKTRLAQASEEAQKMALINRVNPPQDFLKEFSKNKKCFLIFKNGNMNFLIENTQITWKKKISSAKIEEAKTKGQNIKINLAEKGLVDFQLLPGDDVLFPLPPVKSLYLLKDMTKEQSSEQGIIADSYSGLIYMKPNLLEKKIEYLTLENQTRCPYLTLRSQRYYLRTL